MTAAPPQHSGTHSGRPHNREVEDEMICPPAGQDEPPRPATEPRNGRKPADH